MNGVLGYHKLGSKISSHTGNFDSWFCVVLLTLLGDPNVILWKHYSITFAIGYSSL